VTRSGPGGVHTILEGDLVVTPVARAYAIGRMRADGRTQEPLGLRLNRAEALRDACALAGARHRVFLYSSAGTKDYHLVDCADVSKTVE
jgi:hypothetical protein